jgi:hypothetical protein
MPQKKVRSETTAGTVQPAWTPRFATGWAALVYALCVVALMYPAFTGAFLNNPYSDQYGGAAYREFAAASMAEGEGIPLWNPLILGGLPYVAAQHGDIFYPAALIRAAVGFDAGMNLSFALHLFLAGLFTFGLLRAYGFGFFPSLIAGVAYMLSGQIASLVSPGHDGKLYVSALAPLLLWMILRGVRDGRHWAWGLIAITTALCILSPHYQMTYYLAVLAGAWTLYLVLREEDRPAGNARWGRLALAGAAAGLGVAMASIQFLPFFEYIPFSPREGGRGWEYAISWSMPPEEMLNVYLPQFSGILENYWGRNPMKLHSEYLGASVLVLAFAAIGAGARRGFRWFWAGVTVWALLVAFGGHTPFYRLWYLMPMMNVVRAPSMIFFIVCLAVAVFVAAGVERIMTRGISVRYLAGWGVAALLIALMGSVNALGGLATALAEPHRYDAALANQGAVTLGVWRVFLFVLLTLAALWLLLERRVKPLLALGALTAIVAADLWSVDRRYFGWLPPASELYASDPAIDYLRQLDEPGRVIAMPLARQAHRDPFLDSDALMIHRVRAVTGHQGNELQRWVELAGGKSPAPPYNIVQRQFRQLANARFFYTNVELPEETPELPGMRFQHRVGPVGNSVGSQVWLYELDEENPAAWVTPVAIAAPPQATLATVLDPRFNVGLAAIFDTSANVPVQEITALPEPLGIRARTVYGTPGRISVTLDAPAPEGAALVVSENFYPGWQATVNGVAAPTGRAHYSLIGVILPAGATQIELAFSQRSYERGKLLTFLALGVAVLAVIGGVVLDRRRRG